MSVYWVKDSVAADTVGTVDDFDLPFGIQKAFDTFTATDEIRLVAGANNYDENSASWADTTGRDASTKEININTTNGLLDTPMQVYGYTDETTQGECTLDFNLVASGYGFVISVNYYLFKNITIIDCGVDGWRFPSSSQNHVLINCKGMNCTGHGVSTAGGYVMSFIGCEFGDNTLDGINGNIQADLYFCEFHDNGSDGYAGRAGSHSGVCFNVFDGNTTHGMVSSSSDELMYLNNTFEDNGAGDGWTTNGGSEGGKFFNNFFSNNGAYGLGVASGDQIWYMSNNAYYTNGTNHRETAASITDTDLETDDTDPGYTDTGVARDYSISTTFKALGYPWDGTDNLSISGDYSNYMDLGCAQRLEAGGGSAGFSTSIG